MVRSRQAPSSRESKSPIRARTSAVVMPSRIKRRSLVFPVRFVGVVVFAELDVFFLGDFESLDDFWSVVSAVFFFFDVLALALSGFPSAPLNVLYCKSIGSLFFPSQGLSLNSILPSAPVHL